MVDDAVAVFTRDLFLQTLDFVGAEFDDLARLNVNQVIVVLLIRCLVASFAVAKGVPGKDVFVFEQLDRTIDRRQRNRGINRGDAPMEFAHIRMIVRLSQHLKNSATRFGYSKTEFMTNRFDISKF